MERLRDLLVENTGPQWAGAILFVAGGIVLGVIYAAIVSRIIKKLAQKTKTLLDDVLVEKTALPVAMLCVWGGVALGLAKLTFGEKMDHWMGKLSSAIFICLASWIVMKILDAIIVHYAPVDATGVVVVPSEPGMLAQSNMRHVVRRLVNILMVILPVAIIVKSFGYDISAILAGLGIGGAALALAARDILASFFGAAAVIADKPFRVGDRIRFVDKNYDAIDGFVLEIRFRTTRVKTLDNRLVIIPNSVFSAMPVQNVSAEPHTRVVQTVSIRASNGHAKTERAVSILKNLAPEDALFGDQHLVSLVYVGAGIHKITFIFFIAKGADYFGTINAVNLEIVRRFEEAGITTH